MDLEDLKHNLRLQEREVVAEARDLQSFTQNPLYHCVITMFLEKEAAVLFFMRQRQCCHYLKYKEFQGI